MEEATEKTVLGDFADARFTHAGVTTRFFRRDGRFFVNTDGPDGKLADFEIKYTFGVYPLQQYLIELPGGRLQALGIAWDARPRHRAGSAGSTSTRTEAQGRRPAALDRHRPELELPVRRLPLDQPAQELRRRDPHLQDDLVRDRRRLRGLSRPGLEPRRVGEARRRMHAGPTRSKGLSVALRRAAGRHVGDRRRDRQRDALRAAIRRAARSRPARAATRGAASSTTAGIPARRSATPIVSRCSSRASTTPTARCATRSTTTARSCRAGCTRRA